MEDPVNPSRHRYPHCIVWTPIPLITWLFPFVGHMGIATSAGVIRDFAGSYFVSEDDMAFGWPTKYFQLDLSQVEGGCTTYDKAVAQASIEYGHHTHNLFCDNCHSHVALALNQMHYRGKTNHNMVYLTFQMLISGKHLGICGFVKQWLPFALICTTLILVGVFAGF